MKKHILVYLTAGTLAWVAPAVMAQSSTDNSTPSAQTSTAEHRKHDRQELMRIIGLSREDLKGLSKEERQTKISDAIKAKISELEKKKTDGTITPDETKDLAFLKHHSPHHKKAASNT